MVVKYLTYKSKSLRLPFTGRNNRKPFAAAIAVVSSSKDVITDAG